MLGLLSVIEPATVDKALTYVEESMHIKFDDKEPGNKESPRRTRSHFRQEESMLGLLSVIEPATVDEALTDDG